MVIHGTDGNSLYHFLLGGLLVIPCFLSKTRFSSVLAYLSMVLIPILIEFVQAFMPDRTCDLTDIFASYFGSFFILFFIPSPTQLERVKGKMWLL